VAASCVSILRCLLGWGVAEPKFVVTGTGHHGSGYVAEVLWRAGVRCGHEQWFGVPGGERVEDLDGESSWLALGQLDSYEGPVAHQVRHPLPCIGSLARYLSHAADDAYLAARRQWFHPTGDPVADAATCWVEMNHAAAKRSVLTWRVEDLTAEHVVLLARFANVSLSWQAAADALAATSCDVNSHGRMSITWADLAAVGVDEEVAVMARAFGYSV